MRAFEGWYYAQIRPSKTPFPHVVVLMKGRSIMPRPPRAGPTWASLAAELRALGWPPQPGDTFDDLTRKLRLARLVATPGALAIVPALRGQVDALDALADVLRRAGATRVAPEAALIPPARLPALRRTLRRRGVPLADGEPTLSTQTAVTGSPPPELHAAIRFVRALAETLRWPDALTADLPRALPEPLDPAARRRSDALVRAWTAALDAQIDPLGEAPAPWSTPPRPRPTVPPERRQRLTRAIAEARCVRLTYRGARDARTRRVVEPRELYAERGQTYLRAYCRWRQQERLFRLDRIEQDELLDERFGLPAD